jgi:microcin C transport system ATP-binding protein
LASAKRWRWWANPAPVSVSALSVLRLPSPPVSYPSGDIRFMASRCCMPMSAPCAVRGNRIAMIFQEPMVSLNPLHTLEKQLYEVLSLHRGCAKRPRAGRSSTAWSASGSVMPRRLADYPHQLSGGERQR